MSAALQVYSRDFDADFLKLPPAVQARIETKIDWLGLRLHRYPHTRLQGVGAYKQRVGDYRLIYDFDPDKGALHLLAVGHRREVYRSR